MKRIINGITFNTETATEVFSKGSDHLFGWWGIYQTRHGAFFKVVCNHDGSLKEMNPLSDDEAREILERHANHLVEQYFDAFPEYGAAERRMTVRLPAGLAHRVEAAATQQATTVDRYVMRLLEKSVTQDLSP